MTAGWLAFDAPTRARLGVIAAVKRDCFGEPIKVGVAHEPVLAALARGPMRACQLAARLSVRRFALAMTLASLAARGAVVEDGEGFFARVSG
jgi:hypothetical protein